MFLEKSVAFSHHFFMYQWKMAKAQQQISFAKCNLSFICLFVLLATQSQTFLQSHKM